MVLSRYLSAKIATFVQFTKKIVQYLSKNLLFRTETPIFAPEKAKIYSFTMKKTLILLFIMLSTLATGSARSAAPKLKHVHPLNWWSGMQNTELQVLLHGESISDCEVQLVEATDVTIKRVERVENPNYLFVYLDLVKAKPQTFGICLTKPGKHKPYLTQPYELKARSQEPVETFGPQDVMYLLMPDRFINANPKLNHVEGMVEPDVDRKARHDMGRHGGDLAGIVSALDYLQDLGVTAIWPTPVQVNDGRGSYHGYAITDYYQIDPRFGTNEEYRQLVQKCHEHGIKMVMDLVFNHCGANNFLFRDLPQKDWFNYDSQYVQSNYRTASVGDPYASQWDRERTTDGWFVQSMPDLNQRNPLVHDYLIQCSVWWVEFARINGIRQDTYPYADREMMRDWCVALDREYPGFNITGETWINNGPGVAYWQKDSKLSDFNSELKTPMDFPLMTAICQAVGEESDDWEHGLARIYNYLSCDMVYANPNYLLTFLDNHDTDRFQKSAEEAANRARYEQALLMLLTLRGIPQLYYGDEIGMWANKSQGDGVLRQDFPVEALTAAGRDTLQAAYHAYARKLLNWRKSCAALHRGDLTHFCLNQGCYVYSRSLDGERVTVLMNGTSKTQKLELERYREVLPADSAQDVLAGRTRTLGKTLTLKPRQSVVLYYSNR